MKAITISMLSFLFLLLGFLALSQASEQDYHKAFLE
jgi:hypothetical protein